MFLVELFLKKSVRTGLTLFLLGVCPFFAAPFTAQAAAVAGTSAGESSAVKLQEVGLKFKNRLVVADPFLLQAQLDYEKADQAYAWLFRQTIKARNVGRQDWYDLVNFPGITTKADLQRIMGQSFTQSLTRQLLAKVGEQYKDIDGRLYVRSGARGDDINCGKNSYTLERLTANKYILLVKTELLDPTVRKRVVKGYKETRFEYVKTKEGWRFATFESVR